MTNVLTILAVLISTALAIFLLNGFTKYQLKKKLSENNQPITVSYFKGGLFVSIGLLISEVITTFQTISKILPSQSAGDNLILKEISFYCTFFGIIILVFIIVFFFSTVLFKILNKGESVFFEVANNNIHSVIIFLAILLTFVIAIKTGVTPLLDGYIPYPEIPIYR